MKTAESIEYRDFIIAPYGNYGRKWVATNEATNVIFDTSIKNLKARIDAIYKFDETFEGITE
jgi:hypothetical protein